MCVFACFIFSYNAVEILLWNSPKSPNLALFSESIFFEIPLYGGLSHFGARFGLFGFNAYFQFNLLRLEIISNVFDSLSIIFFEEPSIPVTSYSISGSDMKPDLIKISRLIYGSSDFFYLSSTED